jgi:hypothetical protein
MKTKTALFMFLLSGSTAFAQSKPPRDWMPATIAEVTYSDEEKVLPRSQMVKRQVAHIDGPDLSI